MKSRLLFLGPTAALCTPFNASVLLNTRFWSIRDRWIIDDLNGHLNYSINIIKLEHNRNRISTLIFLRCRKQPHHRSRMSSLTFLFLGRVPDKRSRQQIQTTSIAACSWGSMLTGMYTIVYIVREELYDYTNKRVQNGPFHLPSNLRHYITEKMKVQGRSSGGDGGGL